MRVVTPQQMNEIDRLTIHEALIPGMVLMENAALAVANEAVKILKQVQGKEIFIFAGKGNNGGDAFAAARHLFNKGAKVHVYLVGSKNSITGDAAVNLSIITGIGVDTIELNYKEQLKDLVLKLGEADLVLDGIFGTGLKRDVAGIAAELIHIINNKKKTVIAIDIPSGICANTGRVMCTAIRATTTITFGLPKLGLLLNPGCEYAGELVTADISIPERIIQKIDIRINTIDLEHVSRLMPRRFADSNKGDYGKVFVITGSKGMTGAGCLTGRAALRTGAGLVYLGVPESLSHIYDILLIEAVTVPLSDNGEGKLAASCIKAILDKSGTIDVLAVGPGLSLCEDVIEIVGNIITGSKVPLILDADALNALASDLSILSRLKTEAVVTPHPGEMARLTGMSISDVQNNRINIASEFAQKWKVTTVLKGSRTVVALPDGTIYINTIGNPGMATGGTGDVLTGIIASLVAQGLRPSDAAVAGVYLHGLAGDNAAKIKGEHGLIAGDLVEEIPSAIKGLI